MARIELENLNLTFRVTRHGPARLRDHMYARWFPEKWDPIFEVHALQDIDLKLRDGDRVGLIGHNGAGKSTLLKVLADIYPITSGRRRVEGQISALFDIFLGFEPEATGWENIAYRGYLQGETRKSLRSKMQEIGEFSELGGHLGVPVRYYSDGMKMRLGFAIATAIEPDILLVDEAINAGDAVFREKATARVRNVISRASIVVAVSHDHKVLCDLCDTIVWLDHGVIRAVGPAREIVADYEAHSFSRTRAVA